MQPKSRRRLDAAVLAGGGLLVGAAGLAGAALGDQERIASLWVLADVGTDGPAQVTEVVDYDFGALAVDKHGLRRIVPDLDPNAPITVESDTAPDDLAVTREPGGTQLRVGDAARTVTGRHRYRIGFPLPAMLQGDEINWNAVGTEWEVPIEEAEVHLVSDTELLDVRCFVGDAGSETSCDDDLQVIAPGHVAVTVEDLSKGEGVSLEARTGNPVVGPVVAPSPPTEMPAEPGTGLLPPAAAAAAAALVAAVPARWLVRRAGRERVAVGGAADAAWSSANPVGEVRVDADELAQMATTEFAPPEDLSPSHGGIVLTETVAPEHKVAWLIDAAIDGAVELVEEDGRAVRLVRKDGSTEHSAVLDVAFDGRDEIDLGSYDPQFAAAWSQLGTELERWRDQCGLWDAAADRRRVTALLLGIVGVVVGVVVAGVGAALANMNGSGFLVPVALGGVIAGAGLATAVTGWELRVRTPAGSAAWLRVESFRRFLAESEAFHAEEAAKRGVLREYTAWAVATGEVDRWSRAVQTSTAIPSSAGLSYVYLAPLLMASTMATATAPSSSGGVGGGGSVGGGAGGGGGGSW